MDSSRTKCVSAVGSRIVIRHDPLRPTVRSRARLAEIDDLRNPLTAQAAIGRLRKHRCSREQAP